MAMSPSAKPWQELEPSRETAAQLLPRNVRDQLVNNALKNVVQSVAKMKVDKARRDVHDEKMARRRRQETEVERQRDLRANQQQQQAERRQHWVSERQRSGREAFAEKQDGIISKYHGKLHKAEQQRERLRSSHEQQSVRKTAKRAQQQQRLEEFREHERESAEAVRRRTQAKQDRTEACLRKKQMTHSASLKYKELIGEQLETVEAEIAAARKTGNTKKVERLLREFFPGFEKKVSQAFEDAEQHAVEKPIVPRLSVAALNSGSTCSPPDSPRGGWSTRSTLASPSFSSPLFTKSPEPSPRGGGGEVTRKSFAFGPPARRGTMRCSQAVSDSVRSSFGGDKAVNMIRLKQLRNRCELLVDACQRAFQYSDVVTLLANFDHRHFTEEMELLQRQLAAAVGEAVPCAYEEETPRASKGAGMSALLLERSKKLSTPPTLLESTGPLDVANNPILDFHLATLSAKMSDVGQGLDEPIAKQVLGNERKVQIMKMLDALRMLILKHSMEIVH
eukprot:TRINITY_DN13165_c0_g1_i1.p1 TRINITY_DN13165_c0_g1~~TRINITY_DN13165_c0_g1_i1.p1  ORF type:complete len:507 (+),score=145.87 TRINITY_DN13165_c0_g1_i1:70-1590(+)